MTKHDEIEHVVGEVILEECAKALLECVREGDLFECAAGDLAEARGHGVADSDWLAAYDTAIYDIAEVALSKLRERIG